MSILDAFAYSVLCQALQALRAKIAGSTTYPDIGVDIDICVQGSFSYATGRETRRSVIATGAVMQAVLSDAAASSEPLLIHICPGTFVYLSEALRIDSRSFVGIECATVAAGANSDLFSPTEHAQGDGRVCVLSAERLFSGPLVRITSSEAIVTFNSLMFKARFFLA